MNKIKILLYKMFTDSAISAAAIGEQLEDIKYCIEHGMNHLNGGKEGQKWEAERKKAIDLCKADGGSTYNPQNIDCFKKEVDKIRKNDPHFKLYDGLSERERFAFRNFYYSKIY